MFLINHSAVYCVLFYTTELYTTLSSSGSYLKHILRETKRLKFKLIAKRPARNGLAATSERVN